MTRSDKDDSSRDRHSGELGRWARMYAAVIEFLAYIGVLGYVGHWLDGRYDWEPWAMLLGLLLGTGLGLYRLIREGQHLEQ